MRNFKNFIKKIILVACPLLVLGCGVGGMVYIIDSLGLTDSIILMGACCFLRGAWLMFSNMNINIKY
jgi:hypothetical protein|tara:strand:- start:24328 stop:24528 length:201 start_codon:yes stop_codon:yes gene_type:complete